MNWRPFRTIPRSNLFVGVLAALLVLGAHAQSWADAPAPRNTDARVVAEQLIGSLDAGRRETAQNLSRLGFSAQVDETMRVDGHVLHSFSSRTLIETLYRRAEAHTAGEGDRFLAVLYKDASLGSAALASDPAFRDLSKLTNDALSRPISFAPLSALNDVAKQPPLSPAVERAVTLLSQAYSGRHLPHARALVMRNLRLANDGPNKFETVLAASKSSRDAWNTFVRLHTPPPPVESSLRNILRDAKETSGGLSIDPNVYRVMEELSKELPPEYQRYAEVEDALESRRRQYSEVAHATQLRAGEERPVGHPSDASKVMPSNQKTVLAKLEEGPPAASSSGSVGGPGPVPKSGELGSGPKSRAYSSYTGRTFESLGPTTANQTPPGISPTPRTYRRAIVSARAARGIAVGGEVSSEVPTNPRRAYWLPNAKDDRFGRLFVELDADSGGAPQVLASRVLFADSFYAARAILWGNFDEQATFRNGEILVLMSMDPEARHVEKQREQAELRLKLLGLRAAEALEAGDRDNYATVITMAEETLRNLPKGIVVHPGIEGRELAWSASRVDFWFNQRALLSQEASMINGGSPMPEAFQSISLERANTWQFYELDSAVLLGPVEGGARRLVVRSTRPDGSSERGHFAVSMFAVTAPTTKQPPPGGERIEENTYRLPGLEKELQPMLDWLAVNHHDFMRLNDFSEAFSYLRWLRTKEVPMDIIDMDGEGQTIATPDRVVVGKGPSLAK